MQKARKIRAYAAQPAIPVTLQWMLTPNTLRGCVCNATEEFVAHGSAVNCLQIGRKSGSVMVTGGDDKKVNVWALGKANAIMVGLSQLKQI